MVKQLAGSVREFKKDSFLTPVYVVGEVVLETLLPLLMGGLIDNGIDAVNMNYILKTGLLLVVMALLALLLGALSGRTAARASAGLARNLRKDMYYKTQEFSFSNIDKYSTAGIVTRLTTDVTNVQNAYQMIIRVAVRSPIMLVCALVMAFRVNPRLALIFLVVIPVLGLGLWLIIRIVHPVFTRVFKTYDRLNSVVEENLLGIRVVKSYVREDYEKKKFSAVSKEIFKDFSKAEKTLALNTPLLQFCVYACMLLISWFGARLVVGSSMTAGELTSMFTYIMQILMSLMMLSMVLVMITMARSSGERIAELLGEEPGIKNCPEPIREVSDGSIHFENVSFSYSGDREKLCLQHVNLDIQSGETVGIIGGTGSAKTTLVQLIPRLYDATEGCVWVGKNDVRSYDLETLRCSVAMVLQKNTLFSGTIKENLRWGNENATDDQLIHACELAQADHFIQELPQGYDTYIEQGGTNVSGGQKQRICIARALLKNPKILILDDSTSAVDTATDAQIRRAFLAELSGVTKLIIAQRISSVQDADKIIVLDGGVVNGIGTHEELLQSNEIYREVWASQTKGGAIDA